MSEGSAGFSISVGDLSDLAHETRHPCVHDIIKIGGLLWKTSR